MTHLFVDEMTVIYADYWLCKKIEPALLPDYLRIFLKLLGEGEQAGPHPSRRQNSKTCSRRVCLCRTRPFGSFKTSSPDSFE